MGVPEHGNRLQMTYFIDRGIPEYGGWVMTRMLMCSSSLDDLRNETSRLKYQLATVAPPRRKHTLAWLALDQHAEHFIHIAAASFSMILKSFIKHWTPEIVSHMCVYLLDHELLGVPKVVKVWPSRSKEHT